MRPRPSSRFLPALEAVEAKLLLSAGASTTAAAESADQGTVHADRVTPKPTTGFLVYRITNPTKYNDKFVPPFGHVYTYDQQPTPGVTYNILSVAVRNGTAQTFTAQNSDFQVRFPGQKGTFPILTGDQTWAPGQDFIFYVLTHKYYPLPSQVHSGWEFDLDGARSIGIPGPSGIFLRVKYNPATIDHVLDQVVQYGPGNQGGVGIKYGLPNTAIYEFVSSKTDRNDFSGYF